MNGSTNESDNRALRAQMDATHLLSEQILQQNPEELRLLVKWLSESPCNREQYDRLRSLDSRVQECMVERIPVPDNLNDRIFQRLQEEGTSANAVTGSTMFDSTENCDFPGLFEEDDRLGDKAGCLGPSSKDAIQRGSEPHVGPTVEPAVERNPDRSRAGYRRWMISSLATAGVIAVSLFLILMFRPDPPSPKPEYTAELLCNESLDWDPESTGEWSSDLSGAPQDRPFPVHLIRLQACRWKKLTLQEGTEAVVYDLIPPGNSSEPAARLYVFHSPHDYKLPAQFATRPLANRNYRVWSVACQQDLVYVLVYEGDEKRIGNLIRIQQVG